MTSTIEKYTDDSCIEFNLTIVIYQNQSGVLNGSIIVKIGKYVGNFMDFIVYAN